MRSLKLAILAVLLTVPVMAGAGPTTQLHTPLLNVAGNMLVCNVVNAGGAAVIGSLIMIDATTTPVTPHTPFNLAPGQAAVVAAPSGHDGYCRITFGGKAEDVRANLCVMELGRGCIATADAR